MACAVESAFGDAVMLCVIQGIVYCFCIVHARVSMLKYLRLSGADGAARAGLAQLADTFVSDPRRHFTEGQSVRAAVAAVDAARGRFALSLKPSLVAAPRRRLPRLAIPRPGVRRAHAVRAACQMH